MGSDVGRDSKYVAASYIYVCIVAISLIFLDSLVLALPVNNHAGGQTHYVGSGSRKAYAKDAAACHYLVLNQVVPPSPLAL